VNTVLYDDLES